MQASCLGDRMGTPGRTVDRKLARIASGGHGVVTRTQLLSAGVTARQIRRRVESGTLIRVHRGVYRVGHRAPSIEATYLAAVLAGGEGALLGVRAAAHLFALTKGEAPPAEVITRTQRRIEGVTSHRSRTLDARDATTFRGIPVTTVPRTLVDLAAELSPRCTRPRLPRGRCPLRHHAQSGRGSARATADQPGREKAPQSHPRRRPRHPQQARSSLLRAPTQRGPPAPRDQPPSRKPARRLPLAGARTDCRTRRLPLPQLAPLMGTGQASRAGGAGAGRRVSPL